MRFEQLKYLDMAIRLGSLRRAAAELGVAQPSLTQQIQRLEEELDVVLLIRRPGGVTPTDAGTALMPHVRQALQAECGLHQEASAISGLHTGRLRLGTIPAASRLFVPNTVRRFREAYPRVHFEVTEAGSGQVRDSLLEGEFDIGVLGRWRADAAELDGLYTEDLFLGVYSVCVPRDHRLADRSSVTVADLAGEAFVVVKQGHLLREVFDRVASSVNVRVIYQTNTSESARRTVDAGVGISIQSSIEREQLDTSVAVPLDEPWAESAVSVARRAHEQPTPAMSVFLRLIRSEAANYRHRMGSDRQTVSPI